MEQKLVDASAVGEKHAQDAVQTLLKADAQFAAVVGELLDVLAKNNEQYVDDHGYRKELQTVKQVLVIVREEQNAEGQWVALKRKLLATHRGGDDVWVASYPTGCKNPLYIHADGQVHLSTCATGVLIIPKTAEQLEEHYLLAQDCHPWKSLPKQRELNYVIAVDALRQLLSK